MKTLTTLLTSLCVILFITGCGDGNREQDNVGYELHMAESVELLRADRYYVVDSIHLDIDFDFRQFYFFIHHEQLYLFLLGVDDNTLNSYIHLFSMDANGANMLEIYRTPLDESVDFFNILGFEKHDDGYITLVSTDNVIVPPHTREDYFDGLWDFETDYSYVCRSISSTGEIVSEFSIDALNDEERQIRISDIAFDIDGNAVASVSWLPADFELLPGQIMIPEGVGGQSFFLFDRVLTEGFRE